MEEKIIVSLPRKFAIDLKEWIESLKYPDDDEMSVLEQIKWQLNGHLDRSMLNWHSMDEEPEDGDEIIVKFDDGRYLTEIIISAEFDDWKHERLPSDKVRKAVAWAHLPEGGIGTLEHS